MRTFPLLALAACALLAAGCGSESPPAKPSAGTPPADAPGPLAEALKAKADASAEKIPAEVKVVFGEAMNELAASGIIDRALQAPAAAPDFAVQDADGMPVSLKALLAKGPVVLTFYRGGW